MNKANVELMIKQSMEAYHFYSTEWVKGNDAAENDMLLWGERVDMLEKLLTTFN